jgi:hypothetical protein
MDYSLTTLFVVPVGQTTFPSSGSTQNLTAGQLGLFSNTYVALTAGTIVNYPYFYVAQGRTNTVLEGSKRSDKIAGCISATGCKSNVTEWYKVTGCSTHTPEVVEISGWSAHCGDDITITLRAHSSYIDTLWMNGLTRSVTVKAPCCTCGGNPCDTVDVNALINLAIAKLQAAPTGTNPDNVTLSTFFVFENIGGTVLRITAKPLTTYGVPCDVAAFPFEYDRLWFRAFIYSGPATTADFIVSDPCNLVATAAVTQRATYPIGTSNEITQLEKNLYSYQVGALKHLYRMVGYNQKFESFVTDGTYYDTYYIKFNEWDKADNNWGDKVNEDSMVIIAVPTGSAAASALEAILVAGLGAVTAKNTCATTTTTTSTTSLTTTTTTTILIP